MNTIDSAFPATPMLSAMSKPSVSAKSQDDVEARETFQSVMGELLFGQMLKAMRKTVGKPAYFHGGRGEEIFTQHLDQILSKNMAEASGDTFVGPMYELFAARRG